MELGSIVGEGLTVHLTTDDDDFAIWENNTVVEDTLVPHGVDLLSIDRVVLVPNGDNVRVCSGVDVLIAGSTAGHQDLSGHGVIHDCNTAHGITIIGTGSGIVDSSVVRVGIVPVHPLGWTGLEDKASLPAEQHGVIVSTVGALGIVCEKSTDGSVLAEVPGVVCDAVDFTVLATFSSGPGSTDGERSAIREGSLRLVTTLDLHIRECLPSVVARVIKTGPSGVVAACDKDTSTGVETETGAEHVVIGVCDQALGDGLGAVEVGGCQGLAAVGTTKGIGSIR